MSTSHDHRRPEEIENEIIQARARLDDTLHELEERFSPQQLMNTTYEYLRHGGANDFASSLGRTIKENPLPVLLTGAGLVWLIVAQRSSDQSRSDHYQAGYSTTPTGASHLPVPADDMSVHAAGSGSSMAGSVTGAGTTTMGHDPASVGASAPHSQATPSVGSGQSHGSGMTGKAQEMMGKVKDRAQHMGHSVSERAQHVGDRVRHMGSQSSGGSQSMMHSATDRARYAGSQTTHFIQEHPLVAGALGVAIGAALGSMFPSTRVEDEYMGDMRDRTLDKARETGQEKLDQAQEKFHEKAERAQEKAHEKAEQAKTDAQSSRASTASSSSNEEAYAKAGATGSGIGAKGSQTSTKAGNKPEPEADNNYSTQPGNDSPPTRGG